MPDMLSAACNLMFRIAIAAGRGLGDATSAFEPQTITATDIRWAWVYTTNYSYLAGALTVSLSILLLSLVLYPYYRPLDREATLSPMEMRRAFDAALLANADRNATADALFESIEQRKLKDVPTTTRDSLPMQQTIVYSPNIADNDDGGYSLIEREEITPPTVPRQGDTLTHNAAAVIDNMSPDKERTLRFVGQAQIVVPRKDWKFGG